MTRGPVFRGAIAAALVLLGGVAVQRLPLSYLPAGSFPMLQVVLDLPRDGDITHVTETWVIPIETEIRAAGSLKGLRGEVHPGGAWLQALFEPDSDIERKAARLSSGLTWLRTRLPDDAYLGVHPAGDSGSDLVSVVWLADDEGRAHEVRDALRGTRGVRDVELYGGTGAETWIRLRPAGGDGAVRAEQVLREVRRPLVTLGEAKTAGRRLPILSGGGGRGSIDSLPVQSGPTVLPLRSVAEVRETRSEPSSRARHRGRPGVSLLVFKESGASLLEVDRAVREKLDVLSRDPRFEGKLSVVRSEAEPLIELLRALALGLLAALAALLVTGAYVSGLAGAFRVAAVLPVALLAALNGFWFAGLGLNLLSLIALMLALAVVVPVAMLRLLPRARSSAGTVAALVIGGAIVPVAVALGAASRLPVLTEPATAFFVAVLAATPTLYLHPPLTRMRRRARPLGRRLRTLLRDPLTVLLVAGTITLCLMALFGSALRLGETSLQPDPARMVLRVALPEGTTLDGTVERVRRIETELGRLREIESFWTLLRPGGATIVLEVAEPERRPDRLQKLKTLLAYRMPAGVVSIQPAHRVGIGRRQGGGSSGESFEERAETDEEAWRYRILLRSTDLSALLEGYERLRSRTVSLEIPGSDVRLEWNRPSPRIELAPLAETTPDQLLALAGRLRDRTTWPAALPLHGPGERTVRVLSPDSPDDPNEITQREDLLQAAHLEERLTEVPADRVRAVERSAHPSVLRQSGRFVLPVTIRLGKSHPQLRKELREKADRNLSLMPLPPGCDLERPDLEGRNRTAERARELALAALVPVLLLAVAAFHMNSLVAGLGALVPGALGLAAVTPLLRLGRVELDELTLLSLGAVLCGTLPLPLSMMTAVGRTLARNDPPQAVYRVLRERMPGLAAGALALGLLLGVAGLASDPSRFPWSGPLRAGAVAGVVAVAASALVVAPLTLAVLTWMRRDPEERERLRRPPAWSDPGAIPRLAVRSLTKIYPGNVRALVDVSFEITPGVVGVLGPNGAGKTTLLHLLTGLLRPTRGHVFYLDTEVEPINFHTFREHLGFLPQEFNTYATLTAAEFLEHWALERGLSDRRHREEEIARLLRVVGLESEGARKVSDYSGGMRRRVGIALALLADPRVLIVDEPTTGLDVESRMRFRDTLVRVARDRIILFSTHIASDVEAVATRLLVLHRGRLRFDGPPAELLRRAEGRVFETVLGDAEIRPFTRRFRTSTRVRTLDGIRVRAIAPPGQDPPGDTVRPNLEEAYLAEIDLADREEGREPAERRFAFLENLVTRPAGFVRSDTDS